MAHEYLIEPCAKPRMTRADKWQRRPIVLKYRAFKDECKLHGLKLYPAMKVEFRVSMPKSWSNQKKAEMRGQPHTQTPDLDNYLKGLMDAVLEDDSHIHTVHASKRWAKIGSIKVEEL